jgi:hypothetical protein
MIIRLILVICVPKFLNRTTTRLQEAKLEN